MRTKKRKSLTAQAKITLLLLAAISGSALCSPSVVAQKAQSEKERNAVGRSQRAAEDIETLMALPAAKGIPGEIIEKAEAVAVIPSVSRVVLIGLTKGFGVVSRRVPGGWSLPAYYGLGSQGLDLVLDKDQSTDVIVFFMNEKAVELFRKGKIGLEGAKNPDIGIVGSNISRDVLDKADIFIYVLINGRLADIDIDNKASSRTFILNPDNDMNKAVYRMKGSEVLFGQPVNSQSLPEGLNAFQQALVRYFVRP
jgi:lipid-binding SYLF domain-containing protein